MNQSVGSRRMHEEDATPDALFNGSATPALQESWHLRQSWSLNQCYRGTNSGSVSDNKKVDSRLVVLLSKLLLGNLPYTRHVKSKGLTRRVSVLPPLLDFPYLQLLSLFRVHCQSAQQSLFTYALNVKKEPIWVVAQNVRKWIRPQRAESELEDRSRSAHDETRRGRETQHEERHLDGDPWRR